MKDPKERMQIRVEPQLVRALEKMADETGETANALIRKGAWQLVNGTPTTSAASAAPAAGATSLANEPRAIPRANPFGEAPTAPTMAPAPGQTGLVSTYTLKLDDGMVIDLERMGKANRQEAHEVFIELALEALTARKLSAVKKATTVVLKDLPKDFDFDAEQQRLDLEDEQSEGRGTIKAPAPPGTPATSTLSGAVGSTPKPERSYYDPVPVLDDDGVPVPDPFAHAGPDPHLAAMAEEKAVWERLGANKE